MPTLEWCKYSVTDSNVTTLLTRYDPRLAAVLVSIALQTRKYPDGTNLWQVAALIFAQDYFLLPNSCYTPCPEKKGTNSNLGITSSNTDRFSKIFHFYNLLEICNKTVIKYPIAPITRHYTTLWNIAVRKLACPERCGSLAEW